MSGYLVSYEKPIDHFNRSEHNEGVERSSLLHHLLLFHEHNFFGRHLSRVSESNGCTN